MICPLREKGCGGCRDIERMYGDLLREKTAEFRRLFPGAGNIVGMEDPRFYRCKALRTFANGKTGLYAGFYREGTHSVLSVKQCLLEDKRVNDVCFAAAGLLAQTGLRAWDERAQTGLLRHMQVRLAHATGDMAVTIVTAAPDFPGAHDFAQALMRAFPAIRCVCHSVNDRRTSAVMGYSSRVLEGRDELWDELCGLRVALTSRSFYQVNSRQAEKLYARALDLAAITSEDTVLDAYCGVGVIGLLAARRAKAVTGIEIVGDSVLCARRSARVNKIANISFLCADAAAALEKGALAPDCVLVDPPRAGCDQRFLRALTRSPATRAAYISCCPETLRRDVDLLQKDGWRLDAVQPFDLFPYTAHVEAVALLRRG